MIEVELKAKISNIDEISNFLLKLGARLNKEIEEFDEYFQHPCRDFTKTDEAFRIRKISSEDKYRITYKGPKINTISKTREEIELRIDDIKGFTKILDRLGFKSVGKVEKKRKSYQLNEITISLDTVKGLGNFIEMEILVKNKDEINSKLNILFSFGEKIGIKKEDYIQRSYLELLLGL